MSETAKIFWTGRSQAVRLPKQFRFSADEVLISRRADGAVVLKPAGQIDATQEIGKSVANSIDDLRAAIAEGLASGAAGAWDAEEIKRLGRAR